MAIFGSYIGKDRSLMGESVHVIVLDTFVAVIAGVIMFCACFTYGLEVNAGPSLLFDTMATVFSHMPEDAGGVRCSSCLWYLQRCLPCSVSVKIFLQWFASLPDGRVQKDALSVLQESLYLH